MFREIFPENPFIYTVEDGITAKGLMRKLAHDFPEASGLLPYTRLAHHEDYVHKDSILQPDQEYCLIPPVSGG
ncbi:MAG: MoaD/ThiS family protein [SAR324 cluster bacterium]|nr:MoaD/ThiS family protein [SAR324 cluster bacterium]